MNMMKFFDIDAKKWKLLPSVKRKIEALEFYCAEAVGSNLFVAGKCDWSNYCIYRYDTEGNVRERLKHSSGVINNLCVIGDYMYAISPDCNPIPQRYSLSKCQLQTFGIVSVRSRGEHKFYSSGTTAHNSKVCVLYGGMFRTSSGTDKMHNATLHCFDPGKNQWEVKASTCQPHFGSTLFVVNSRLYVAGGKDCIDRYGSLKGNPATVEVYNEKNNSWSVVEQKHIPPNNLGAVEIEGRVYFIINKFPIDSGIRIPPEERYPVPLDEWENLGKIDKTAVLCYLPVKRKRLKTE